MFVVLGFLLTFTLASIIPSLALTFRRLHDIGRSAWSLLVVLIPFVGPFVMLYWFFKASEAGANKYGSSP
jgi:uncharacterized membrane protein YhaH (DUF805 family)